MQREKDERDSDAGYLSAAVAHEVKNHSKTPRSYSTDRSSLPLDRQPSDEIFVFRPGTAVTIVTDVKG